MSSLLQAKNSAAVHNCCGIVNKPWSGLQVMLRQPRSARGAAVIVSSCLVAKQRQVFQARSLYVICRSESLVDGVVSLRLVVRRERAWNKDGGEARGFGTRRKPRTSRRTGAAAGCACQDRPRRKVLPRVIARRAPFNFPLAITSITARAFRPPVARPASDERLKSLGAIQKLCLLDNISSDRHYGGRRVH